jgi:hypothetical protein
MQKLASLLAYRFNNLRVAMAYRADCPAGKHIQYLIPVGVEAVTALAFGDDPRQTLVIADNVLVK